jgi:hypothetical protein
VFGVYGEAEGATRPKRARCGSNASENTTYLAFSFFFLPRHLLDRTHRHVSLLRNGAIGCQKKNADIIIESNIGACVEFQIGN